MWTVVYIAPHKKEADKMKNLLAGEGLLVKLKTAGVTPGSECGPVEVLVPEAEVEEALEIINSN